MLGEILQDVHAQVLEERGGEVASYIPALARAVPEDFGLAIVTTGGDVYTAGESETKFTIQSVSKAFTLALALHAWGTEKTYQHVGTEPSGDAFNSVVLDPITSVPFNPMINSGAISMTGLLRDIHGDDTFAEMTKRCVQHANKHCEGRILSMLEGGYNPEGLASASVAHVKALVF